MPEPRIAVLVWLLAACAAGCGASGAANQPYRPIPAAAAGVVAARGAEQETLLGQLDDLPADVTVPIGARAFRAAPAYRAASGRTCRSVVETAVDGSQALGPILACRDASGWFFVPVSVCEATAPQPEQMNAPITAEAATPGDVR